MMGWMRKLKGKKLEKLEPVYDMFRAFIEGDYGPVMKAAEEQSGTVRQRHFRQRLALDGMRRGFG